MGQKRKQGDVRAEESPAEAPAEYEFVWADGVQLRVVKPYKYCFRTYAKARWLGRTLHEVCATEFGANSPEYYRDAIIEGRMRVRGNVVSPEYQLRNGDAVTHETMRHEPPVLGGAGALSEDGRAAQIAVVGETEELVAVDKPPTMPVHPSGAYHHNTLLHILGHERPHWRRGVSCGLHPVHRLDRLTSGLVLLAKTPAVARSVCQEILDGSVKKEYLARVRGRFPAATEEEQLPEAWRAASLQHVSSASDVPNEVQESSSASGDRRCGAAGAGDSIAAGSAGSVDKPCSGGGPSSGLSYASLAWSADGAVRLCCPLRCVSHRDGVHECHPEGRPAITIFACVGYDDASNTSLVKCSPVTGRTHQIRIHLQQLGYPIANDPCYGGDATTGVGGKGGHCDEKVGCKARGEVEARNGVVGGDFARTGTPAPVFTVTQLRCRGIWLHALRYSGPGFTFATQAPPWARCFGAAEGADRSS
mmetsp:Transcript_54519/g.152022  ORF Transcript_54519/g.152022 Transcript_54519/m.152022 type:complete len:476 (-) Transcript_54519:92-1519(-)